MDVPRTELYFYQDDAGEAPVIDWLRKLRRKERRAYAKCVTRIQTLAELGHELRRPLADYLRDGVYELRARHGHVNYRMLYFFHGKAAAILAHALTKEAKVPNVDIERAIQRKKAFEKNPSRHTYQGDIENG